MKEMSVRQERVAEQIRAELGKCLTKVGFKSPLISGMISFSHVWVSPDLKNARAYFTTLHSADKEMTTELAKALNAEAFRFQQNLAKFSRKSTPKLKFLPDEDSVKTARIEAIFNQVTAAS